MQYNLSVKVRFSQKSRCGYTSDTAIFPFCFRLQFTDSCEYNGWLHKQDLSTLSLEQKNPQHNIYSQGRMSRFSKPYLSSNNKLWCCYQVFHSRIRERTLL